MSFIPLMVEERQLDSDEEEDRLQIDEEEDEEILALRRKSQQLQQPSCEPDDLYCWTHKHFDTWEPTEVVSWVTHLANKDPHIEFSKLHLEKFYHLSGPQLQALSQNQLLLIEPTYGSLIYLAFQKLMKNSEFKSPFTVLDIDNLSDFEDGHDSCFESDFHEPTDRPDTPPIDYSMRSGQFSFPTPPPSSAVQPPVPPVQKPPPPLIPLFDHIQAQEPPRVAKRGRPPKNRDPNDPRCAKSAKRNGNASRELLWKFVCELLGSPQYNPSHICWEKKEEGIFRFVQSEKCAQMWGSRKNNVKMTYEKMSRAMRYCRSSEFFADVPKDQNYPKKLCFKFGPKATGWKKLL